MATISSQPPQRQDAYRIPLVEHRFNGWPTLQPYVHDCDISYQGIRFRVFFQRHRHLPLNPTLAVHGDILVMRVGQNRQNVVNPRTGDSKRARLIARR